jgi:hypothetical protein
VIELRVLTPDDWPAWRELRLAALAEPPCAFGSRLADWQGDRDREQRWRDRLGIPGSYNVIAVLDGQPAGMASGVPALNLCSRTASLDQESRSPSSGSSVSTSGRARARR